MAHRPRVAAALDSADGLLGDAIEAAVKFRHRQRLARHGSLHALEPGPGWWAEGDPPPRPGCELEVLIDGAEAFKAMADAIRGARK